MQEGQVDGVDEKREKLELQTLILAEKRKQVDESLKKISDLEKQLQHLQDVLRHDKTDLSTSINAFDNEYNKFIESFTELREGKSNNGADNDKQKSIEAIKQEFTGLRTEALNEISEKLETLSKTPTKWFFQFWSDKPTTAELEKQQQELNGTKNELENMGASEINEINAICEAIEQKKAQIKQRLDDIKQLNSKVIEKKRLEEEKKQQEENRIKAENEALKSIKSDTKTNRNNTITDDEVNKIANWLINDQQATAVKREDIIEQCKIFGVNDFEAFKVAFNEQREIEEMQEMVKNDLNEDLSAKQIKEMMRVLNVRNADELRSKIKNDTQDMITTIGGDGVNETLGKLNDGKKNITDCIDAVNGLATNKDKPLIKKPENGINNLKHMMDSIKKDLDNKNIFIKFLMLFGYDPDGLVTAYNVAKEKLKQAKKETRQNILNNTGNDVRMGNFFGNGQQYNTYNTLLSDNTQSTYGQQSMLPQTAQSLLH